MSVYTAFIKPVALPEIDASGLTAEPVLTNHRLGVHVSAITFKPSRVDETIKGIIPAIMKPTLETAGVLFGIAKAEYFGNDPVAQDIGTGMYVYILTPDAPTANIIKRAVDFVKDRTKVGTESVGDGGGIYHTSVYHQPTELEDGPLLLQAMQAAAGQQIQFGNVHSSVMKRRTSMSKVSFSKVGVDQYRQHLSTLSEAELINIFAGSDDENVDEFGDKTSAAMLAADELLLRAGVAVEVDTSGDDTEGIDKAVRYAQHMQRIASDRGIVLGSDEDLFR